MLNFINVSQTSYTVMMTINDLILFSLFSKTLKVYLNLALGLQTLLLIKILSKLYNIICTQLH